MCQWAAYFIHIAAPQIDWRVVSLEVTKLYKIKIICNILEALFITFHHCSLLFISFFRTFLSHLSLVIHPSIPPSSSIHPSIKMYILWSCVYMTSIWCFYADMTILPLPGPPSYRSSRIALLTTEGTCLSWPLAPVLHQALCPALGLQFADIPRYSCCISLPVPIFASWIQIFAGSRPQLCLSTVFMVETQPMLIFPSCVSENMFGL